MCCKCFVLMKNCWNCGNLKKNRSVKANEKGKTMEDQQTVEKLQAVENR